MKADMHIHTRHSPDSLASPEKIAKISAKRGIDCIAVTDHNTAKSWSEMSRAVKKSGICLINGEEIKAVLNGKTVGEILGYFLTEEIRPGNPLDIIDEIRSQGGISSIAHPFDRGGKLFSIPEVVKKVDAIEVFNARILRSAKNDKALALATKNKKGFTAGSDAHSVFETGKTYIECGAGDAEELREAILKRRVKVIGKKSCPMVRVFSMAARIRKNFSSFIVKQ